MKKTIIALSLTTLFSTGVMANSMHVNASTANNIGTETLTSYTSGDMTPDRNGPTVSRPTPDSSVPDRDGPTVDRPQPDSSVPDRPTPDTTPDRPTPDTTPDRPEPTDPDFGYTPEADPPNRGEPADPSYGITPPSERELIADLQQQMNQRFAEMEEHMDGVRAGMHAVTNARPFVTEGEFAIGAGMGFSGNKEALAIGGAYGFNEKISVSGTFHYETSGRVSSSEVAGGVGIQYKF
ncbi:YadA C-terminal domain-containing protein [Enterovibrio norvegicus]|uniref:YadA C-terminal domain-containing protein n=1 Tax=Enterovibrio norvegicus TaxID=188144 RepID=UPI0003035306|nr:YadA C-terminal domain-containing protein [Enterovibrio norvegicus]